MMREKAKVGMERDEVAFFGTVETLPPMVRKLLLAMAAGKNVQIQSPTAALYLCRMGIIFLVRSSEQERLVWRFTQAGLVVISLLKEMRRISQIAGGWSSLSDLVIGPGEAVAGRELMKLAGRRRRPVLKKVP